MIEDANQISPVSIPVVPQTKRRAIFGFSRHSAIEEEVGSYASLPVVEKDPLEFLEKQVKCSSKSDASIKNSFTYPSQNHLVEKICLKCM